VTLDIRGNYWLPNVIVKDQNREYATDPFTKLLRENIVFVASPIDDQVANAVCAQLLHLESENPDKDINIYINSPGGDINALFAIYDTMSYIKPDIVTICFGQAASAAAVLLAAGTPEKRYALPHARILIHQPYSGAQGQVSDIELAANEIARLKEALEGLLSRHTGQSLDKIHTDTDRDFIMTAAEAVEYGVIDTVIESRNAVDNTGPITALNGS